MGTNTPRFSLPNLVVSQAHKEISHNEALALIDSLLHPVIEGAASSPPTLTESDAGKCWLIQAPSSGLWSNMEHAIASWTGASWRFIVPIAGMPVWDKQNNTELRFINGQWAAPEAISAPSGGTVIDVETRTVLTALLVQLRNVGLIAV